MSQFLRVNDGVWAWAGVSRRVSLDQGWMTHGDRKRSGWKTERKRLQQRQTDDIVRVVKKRMRNDR